MRVTELAICRRIPSRMPHCCTEEMKLKGIQGFCRIPWINLPTDELCKNGQLIGINVEFAGRGLEGSLTVIGMRSSLVAQMISVALFAKRISVEKIL